MKRFAMILMACALVMGMSQCQKEKPNENNNEDEKITITLRLVGGSKLGITPGASTASISYGQGDIINVGYKDKYAGYLTCQSDGITFTGEIHPHAIVEEGNPLQFFIIGGLDAYSLYNGIISESLITYSLADQSAAPAVVSCGTSNENYSSDLTTYTAFLSNQCALVKFTMDFSTGAPVTISGVKNEVVVHCDGTVETTATTGNIITYGTGNTRLAVVPLNQGMVTSGTVSIQGVSEAGTYTIPTTAVVNGYIKNATITQSRVTTVSPTYITTNSAKAIGKVNVGSPTECGILYAKASYIGSDTPADVLTLENAENDVNVFKIIGAAATSFDADLTGLDPNTVYYVRAYAINDAGVVIYGDDVIPFATRRNYFVDDGHQGVMRKRTADGDDSDEVFLFSVSATKQVGFSMGDLQYKAEGSYYDANNNVVGGTWRFAEYQFECVGGVVKGQSYGLVYENGVKCDNSLISSTYNGWIDLFGWGTSGCNHGARCYEPWSAIDGNNQSYHYAYGIQNRNLNSDTGFADWGIYHSSTTQGHGDVISNGNGVAWRTPQGGTEGGNTREWTYLLSDRTCSYHRYAAVALTVRGTSDNGVSTVNGVSACGTTVNGLVIFPDTFTWPSLVSELSTFDHSGGNYPQKLTEAQWSLLEQAGAVFLPAAGGWRMGTTIQNGPSYWEYWSATYYDNRYAWVMVNGGISDSYGHRNAGYPVRLVCDE